jgi:hypothetical protein
MRSIYISIIVFVFLISSQVSAIAQCAMCRAGLENNVSNGETTIGAGLNMGILYLLITPYLMAVVLGYLWYRNAKKRKAKFLFHGEKF